MSQQPKTLKSGLGKEVYEKQMNKFDKTKYSQVCTWINSVLGLSLEAGGPEKFEQDFQDGKVIVQLMLAVNPNNSLKSRLQKELKGNLKITAKYMSRITAFNLVLKEMKLDHCLITENDLATGRDLTGPLDNIFLFGVEMNRQSDKYPGGKNGIKPKPNTGNRMDDD